MAAKQILGTIEGFTVERVLIPSVEIGNAMSAVADKSVTQKVLASFYADVIRSGATDVKELNAAIVKRWSRSGLNRVKEMAWKELQH